MAARRAPSAGKQPSGERAGGARGYGQSRGDQRDHHANQRDNHGNDYRNYGFQDGGYRGHDRAAGPDHAWYRGDRLPAEYNSRYYVVDDWRGHHLSAPPRGYHWVQAGNDYVLAAIATGVIASILLNH